MKTTGTWLRLWAGLTLAGTLSLYGAEATLLGSWCLEDENLVITFVDNDSVLVTSSTEEGVNGQGSYEKQDSMFVATLVNDDLEIRMGYQYTWKNDSVLDARTLFLTVNGDSVSHPRGPIIMERCATQDSTDQKLPADSEQKKE
jgi:hypothetical protein